MSHNHESIKRKIIQKQIDDETVKEKQYTPNINKINLYFKLDDKEPLFAETDGYNSFLSYLTKTNYELTYRTNSVVYDRIKNISEKYNVKDRKEVDFRLLDLHGSNENIENVFVVRLTDSINYLTSFSSKDYWNYFLYDLEQAIKQFYLNIKDKLEYEKRIKYTGELGLECLALMKKIKDEIDPFQKINLRNEFVGKFDLKKELDEKNLLVEGNIKCKKNLKPNWQVLIPKINYYDLIEKYNIKSIEDVEILEVPFERND